jgi:hypothetical protein
MKAMAKDKKVIFANEDLIRNLKLNESLFKEAPKYLDREPLLQGKKAQYS